MLGFTLTDQARFGWEKDRAATYEAAMDCAARALAADPGCSEAYLTIGYVRIFQRRHDEAVGARENANTPSPNRVGAFLMGGIDYRHCWEFKKKGLLVESARQIVTNGL